jgi:hypothetical protein
MKTKTPLYIDPLDDDGYPTEEFLQYIRDFDHSGDMSEFLRTLEEGWWCSDWGYKLHRKYRGAQILELHTGGWSGNEETIGAILDNIYLTHFKMRYEKWLAGGHYYFKISVEQKAKELKNGI